jgi:hypothetical protein
MNKEKERKPDQKSTVSASLGTQPQIFLTAWWFSNFKKKKITSPICSRVAAVFRQGFISPKIELKNSFFFSCQICVLICRSWSSPATAVAKLLYTKLRSLQAYCEEKQTLTTCCLLSTLRKRPAAAFSRQGFISPKIDWVSPINVTGTPITVLPFCEHLLPSKAK